MLLDDDQWEALPDRAEAAGEYAADLKLGRHWSLPSAPMAPEPPGTHAVAIHQGVMELTPPQWLPDSLATHCGACHKPFRALTRLRHHCRCCGRIFCHSCSTQSALLPPKFNCRVPERVCDTCAAMLAPLQPYLAGTQAAAAQPPVHDAVLDMVSLRAWLNNPYCTTLEQDIYKAANVLAKFTQTSRLQPEASIPAAVLSGACGLVIMSVLKLGACWSATFGTGVVVTRSSTGQWSAPCAVAAAGLGWGLQIGGELTDLLLVLRTPDAVRAVCGTLHLGLGGSMGMALGPVGRCADASVTLSSAALRKPGAAYAYSCSQGAFVGVSLEGSLLRIRNSVNHAFYGLPVSAHSLLIERSFAPPPAAAALYDALHDLMRKYEVKQVYTPQGSASAHRWGLTAATTATASAAPITNTQDAPYSGHTVSSFLEDPYESRDAFEVRAVRQDAPPVHSSTRSAAEGAPCDHVSEPPRASTAAWMASLPSAPQTPVPHWTMTEPAPLVGASGKVAVQEAQEEEEEEPAYMWKLFE